MIVINISFRKICFFIIILLLCIVMFSEVRKINVVGISTVTNDCDIKNELFIDAVNFVGTCSKKDTAIIWAEGVKNRNGALQYIAMNKNLKEQYRKMLDNKFTNWVTGVSSPWIGSYELFYDGSNIFRIKFDTYTSTGFFNSQYALIELLEEDGFFRIVNIKIDEDLAPYTAIDGVELYEK